MYNPTVIVTSINVRSALRSTSFNGRNSEPTMIRFGSGMMTCKPYLNSRGTDSDNSIPVKSPSSEKEIKVQVKSVTFKDEEDNGVLVSPSSESTGSLNSPLSESAEDLQFPLSEHESQRNEAAIRLQKVYKSFRTRRRLADCAVLAEQRWWKLLDFAELKLSSVSFFQIEKPGTAFSRWSRARTRAAKVGKGLSKDEKARKLALQHWLEAIDPRHRYGHNLQFYYVTWLLCDSKQPFFYWLDIGDGKEVNLDRCPRSKLHQQCIKYLGPKERTDYEVIVDNGRLVYRQSGQVIDTTGEPGEVKWIFVLSTSKTLYVGKKNKGRFQHSSFLAGGATLSAGRIEAENGILKAIWPHSGHYLPTEENFQEFMSFLLERNVDLTNVKRSSSEEGEFTTCPSRAEPSQAGKNLDAGNSRESILRMSQALNSKLTKLEIPKREGSIEDLENEALPPAPRCSSTPQDFASQYYYFSDDDDSSDSDIECEEKSDESPFSTLQKPNLFDEDQEDGKHIPKEKIVQRIDSHKGTQSYQLARQLGSKWTTGVGPRIGCMRDYPSELRLRILEQACLDPRPKGVTRSATILHRQHKPQHHRRSSALV